MRKVCYEKHEEIDFPSPMTVKRVNLNELSVNHQSNVEFIDVMPHAAFPTSVLPFASKCEPHRKYVHAASPHGSIRSHIFLDSLDYPGGGGGLHKRG